MCWGVNIKSEYVCMYGCMYVCMCIGVCVWQRCLFTLCKYNL